MNSDSKFWLTIISIIACVIVTLIVSIAWYNAHVAELYVKAGYSMQSLVGQSCPIWTK